MKKKVIIFSAPSGSGKSTIVNYLLAKDFGLGFRGLQRAGRPGEKRNTGKSIISFQRMSLKKELRRRIS